MRTLAAVAATAQAKMAAENFPVALRVLPVRIRDDLGLVYRFARFVDDVGDDPDGLIGRNADRGELLDVVAAELRAVPQASLAPVADLAPLLRDGRVPVQPFLDLVAANRQDQVVADYRSFDDLVGYCALSANPVGRIVLYLAGGATTANVRDSDAICTALQVLEHCQDVGEDARAGRVYLPQEDLERANVRPDELAGTRTSAQLRAAVAVQVRRSRQLLAEGRPLVSRLHGWARLAVAGYLAGGLATADALERATYDVLGRTITPTKPRTARHLLSVLARTA